MGSLTTCLKKAGDLLDASDRKAIISRARALRAGGMPSAEASRRAVEERAAEVQAMIDAAPEPQPRERAAPVAAPEAKELTEVEAQTLKPSRKERMLGELLEQATDPQIKADLTKQIEAERKRRVDEARGEEYLRLADATDDADLRRDLEGKAAKLGVTRAIPTPEAVEMPVAEVIEVGEDIAIDEADWRAANLLGSQDADRAKALARALRIDPQAAEAAAVQFNNQPRALDRAIDDIINRKEADDANERQGAAEGGEGLQPPAGRGEGGQEAGGRSDQPGEGSIADSAQRQAGDARQRAAPQPEAGRPQDDRERRRVDRDLRAIEGARRQSGEPTSLQIVPDSEVHAAFARGVADSFRAPIYFVRNTDGPSGFNAVNVDGSIYINVDGDAPAVALAVHEVGHSLPADIKADLIDSVMATVTMEQKLAFLREFPFYSRLEAAKRDEELVMRIIEQDAQNPAFWDTLAQRLGDSRFGQVARSILGALDRILSGFAKEDSSEFTSDIKRVRKAVADAYAMAEARQQMGQAREGGASFSGRRIKRKIADAGMSEAAFKRWSNDAPLITSDAAKTHEFKTGQKVVVEAFHGTKRPDRVGEVFQRKRATSGPMAFFTSDPALASSYAQGKDDTSLSREDIGYEQWFKVKMPGERTPRDIVRAWYVLPADVKQRVSELAPRVRMDDDMNPVLGDENHRAGTGSYDYNLDATKTQYDRRGNPLKALVEDWLNSGNLFDVEDGFMDVLRLAGMPMDMVKMDDPRAELPFVYKAFVQMQRPLVTSDVPQSVRDALANAAKRDRSRAQQGGADAWDKNTRTLREWVADMGGERSEYVWTSIPDKVTDVLRSQGYDGIIDWSGKGGGDIKAPVYIPFEETQVKSAWNRGTFDADKKNIMMSERRRPDVSPLGFYSQLARSIEAGPGKGGAQAWKDYIRGQQSKGVKADEVEWSGVNEWLDMQQGPITRDALAEFVRGNGVQVTETVLGGAGNTFKNMGRAEMAAAYRRIVGYDPIEDDPNITDDELRDLLQSYAQESGESDGITEDGRPMPKYGRYTIPGGTNYREVLLTLPTPADDRMPAAKKIGDQMALLREEAAPGVDYMRTPEYRALQDQMRALNDAPDPRQNAYQSSHWGGTLNILAHIRLNDRTDAEGKRVLFVEEIQSDWAQEGKRKGFKKPEPADFNVEVRLVGSWHPQFPETKDKWRVTVDGQDRGYIQAADENEARYKASANETNRRDNSGAVPPAPFIGKTDAWVALALKRAIKMAVDEGYDRVAFVTGEQSAERYDLSKQVDSIDYTKTDDGQYTLKVKLSGDGGYQAMRDLSASALEDAVGKEVAKKIIANEGREPGVPVGSGLLKGLDLKVGGEGMRAFYDKIVPSVLKEVLRKVGGGSFATVEFQNPIRPSWSGSTREELAANQRKAEAEYKPTLLQPGFDITPAMREKVAGGVPLFSERRRPANPDSVKPQQTGGKIEPARKPLLLAKR
jgi:hypothetical protein